MTYFLKPNRNYVIIGSGCKRMVYLLNRFQFTIQNEDLGTTSVENLFINHYLPKAPGDFVKVYLLGLKFCFHNDDSFSNEMIAKTLDLLESDVLKAWDYWQEQGIISIKEDNEKRTIISFLSIKEVVLNKSSLAQAIPIKSSAQELVQSRKNKRIREMHNIIEKMYGRPLSPVEMKLYKEWMDDYSFTPEVIVLLLEDCFNRGHSEMAYIKQVALNWYNGGVKKPEDAEKYMMHHKEKWEKYYKIMSALGLKRPPTKKEVELMDKWFSTYQMGLEIILEGCSKTIAISQPNFSYIDKVLSDWHKKGFKTLDQVREEEPQTPRKKTSSKNSKKSTNTKLDMDHNYDMDRLEEKLLKRTRSDPND